MGSRGKPFYRVVVAESSTARDGRFIEILGHYDPCTDPATIKIDEEKALLWLNRGAQPTDTAEALLKKQNIFQKFLAAKAPKKAKKTAVATEAVAVEVEDQPAEVAPVKKRRTKAVTEKTETPEESVVTSDEQS